MPIVPRNSECFREHAASNPCPYDVNVKDRNIGGIKVIADNPARRLQANARRLQKPVPNGPRADRGEVDRTVDPRQGSCEPDCSLMREPVSSELSSDQERFAEDALDHLRGNLAALPHERRPYRFEGGKPELERHAEASEEASSDLFP